MKRFSHGRRAFLVGSAVAGGGLVLGFWLWKSRRPRHAVAVGIDSEQRLRPNAWLRIAPDGMVTVMVAESEMGQGVLTSMAMIVAEELDVAWSQVRAEIAPSDPEYGFRVTGGSYSVRGSWDRLRQAGATARTMLVAAAADTWGVPVAECRAEQGTVVHAGSKRRLSYGELTASAARMPLPEQVTLKPADRYRLLGQPLPRLDLSDKVTGRAVYGVDAQVPEMRIATIAHCPVFGGKLVSMDRQKALTVAGVQAVVEIDSGVAVVADSYWTAQQGLKQLNPRWDHGPHAAVSSATIQAHFNELAGKDGAVAKEIGDVRAAAAGAVRRIEATYDLPFQAHATMEPMNATAWVHDGRCEVWAPTQSPSRAQETAAGHLDGKLARQWEKVRRRLGGHLADRVRVHTTAIGCGLGRRLEQDYVSEAVQIAKAIGAPVKLIWSREEDMQHDYYRPASHNRLIATVDASGRLVSWQHKLIAPSINESRWPGSVKNGVDSSVVQGAVNLPYRIPNLRVEYVMAKTPVPLGFWRSVGHSSNCFVTECFLDEVAALSGIDPVAWRLDLLEDERLKAVLKLAAEKSGWDRALPSGRGRGVALFSGYGSYVAQVAEVSVGKNGTVRVHRVVCAMDCGQVINPDTIAAQMEGSVALALSAVLKGAITLRDGRVEQGNFHDFPILRMSEMPRVQVHIVPSHESPGGVGEPGVPPLAPAVANAIYAVTGKRSRQLPVSGVTGRSAKL